MPTYTTGTHSSSWDDSGLPKSLREYLAAGAEQGDRNNALFAAACQFRDCGYAQADAEISLLKRGIADGLPASEILKAIASAYQKAPRAAAGTSSKTAAATTGFHKNSPPMTTSLPAPMADGFRIFVETVFEEGERVAIGKGSRKPDGTLSIDYGDARLRRMWLKNGPPQNLEGVFARINPMGYRGAKNEDVTAYRHVLVEFDCDKNGNPVPKELQYAALLNSGFPISTVVDSGNRSLQGSVRIDALDKTQYDERTEIVYAHFRQYDFFDDSNKAPNKWCRLPGCERQLFDASGNPTVVASQELRAFKIGPASWLNTRTRIGLPKKSAGNTTAKKQLGS